MSTPAASSEQIAACSIFHQEVLPVDGKLPARVQLMPMGTHRPRNGSPAVVILADRAHAEAVVAASAAYHGPNAMVVDYDHQTVRAPGVAGQAPAAGWVRNITAEDDGIWGDVEWTGTASAELSDRRYRYISPYFFHRPDGRVTRIINAGLTNTPNLDLAAVASAMSPEEGNPNPMNLKAIASALGLGEDADEAAVLAAIGRNKALGDTLTATASALGVTVGADLAAVASAIEAKAGNPDPAKFVPVSAVAEMQATMSSLQTRLDERDSADKAATIAAAIKSGKLPPALKAHAESLDAAALASFLGAMPETGLGKSTLAGDPPAGDGQLTGEERAVASAMGLTDEEFLAAKKKEAN